MDAGYVRRAVEDQAAGGFTGAVLVRWGETIIVEQGFGQANRAEGIPNTPQTRFGIASGTKLFTAVAINQLVDAGELRLDARLADCLPFAFPLFDPGVTIRPAYGRRA
jgi:CubicO group peptidase (beta-lactamase class C family)